MNSDLHAIGMIAVICWMIWAICRVLEWNPTCTTTGHAVDDTMRCTRCKRLIAPQEHDYE